MLLSTGVGLSSGDFVLDGDPAPSPNRGSGPQFLANVYCGETAALIKIPLGTEVVLGLSDIVLDGGTAPNYRPMSVVAKRLDGLRCHLV